MDFTTWLTYLGMILLFMSTPGPSHLLMISVGLKNGFKRSLATAAGDLSANVIQMCLAAFGLAALLMSTRYGFTVIKWAGVCYLAWMGVQQIIRSFNATDEASALPVSTYSKLWMTGFITSAANPKAVVFFAALFPQFIDQSSALLPQLLVLGTTYLLVDAAFLTFYGKTSSWLADKISQPGRALLDRVSGAGLLGCALLLGLKTQENT